MPKENINEDRLAVLAIAYHNLGVEFEHLKRVNLAQIIFNIYSFYYFFGIKYISYYL